VGSEKPERGSKTQGNWASRLSNFWDFFVWRYPNYSCRDWLPWTKPGYITMTSNNQWSDGIAAYPAPVQKVQKIAGKVLASFFGINTASSSLIIFQRAKLSTRSITHLCWCN
jgi:hypothetical protein